jgi:pimeloyl-ACP methyl ester carboxylesterase
MSRSVNLDTHVQDVLNVLHWEELSDVVLCGHSYGGMVITGVADRAASRIRSLVYLDAFVPENGQSVLDFMSPDRVAQIYDSVSKNGAGWLIPPRPAAFFDVNAIRPGWIGCAYRIRSPASNRKSCSPVPSHRPASEPTFRPLATRAPPSARLRTGFGVIRAGR